MDLSSGIAGIDTLVEQAGRIAESLPLADADRKRLQTEMGALLQQHGGNLQQAVNTEMDTRQKLMMAEIQQGDAYTSRARPTVVYAGLLFILLNYVVVPGVGYLSGASTISCDKNGKPSTCEVQGGIPLPREFWWAWAGIVGTWSVGRSYEKSRGANRVSSMITGSSVPVAGAGTDPRAVG